MKGTILVRSARMPILLQDQGRPGWADIAVPTSGAFDADAAALAARLVGNPPQSAVLEITMGAVALQADVATTAVICGAVADIRVGERPAAVNEVVSWPAGAVLQIAGVSSGVRNYLAVRGGFSVRSVLGSVSTDVLSGLGPSPLRAGDRIRLAQAPAEFPRVDHVPAASYPPEVLRVCLGPRHDWFADDAVAALREAVYLVGADSNRIGLRLEGPPLRRARSGELASEPLQRGAIQVPPNGQPIIMGPDHPTTGGYPVIATVLSRDWSALGQLRPGDPVRFAVHSCGGSESRPRPEVC